MATMNKLILATVLTGLLLSSCQSDKVKSENVDSSMVDPKNPPVIKFEESVYDFGTISQGEKVKHTYFFKNTGKSPLIIHSAQGSCGCTIPEWPKEPVQPGEEGKIEVSFNSEYKSGHQEKMVTILANTKPTKTFLKITGEVVVPDKK
jgi:hypothetical protein